MWIRHENEIINLSNIANFYIDDFKDPFDRTCDHPVIKSIGVDDFRTRIDEGEHIQLMDDKQVFNFIKEYLKAEELR